MVFRRFHADAIVLADRNDQTATLNKFLWRQSEGAPRCLLIDASEASGISHFLRYSTQMADGKADAIYVDLDQHNLKDVADRLDKKRAKSLSWRLKTLLDARFIWPLLVKGLARAPLQSWWKPAVVFGGGVVEGLFFSPVGSEPVERFVGMVARSRIRKPAVVFVDNVQSRPSSIIDLLRATYAPEYAPAMFILAYVRRSGVPGFSEFEQKIRSKSGHAVEVMRFPQPDDLLLSAIEPERDRAERSKLLEASTRNIHKLIMLLQGRSVKADSLSPLETYIVQALIAAGQPLRFSDLRMLCTTSPLVTTPDRAMLQSAVDHLTDGNLAYSFRADDLDTLVALVGTSNPAVASLAGNLRLIAIQSELYDYFSAAHGASVRHSLSSTAALLYRLCKKVAPEHIPRRAQTLVDAALKLGDVTDARNYIAEALGGSADLHACFVNVAFYISVHDYQPVLDLLDQLGRPVWGQHRVFRIIHAIALNRVRQHDAAYAELDTLLADAIEPEEVAVLASYKIAGLLHDGLNEEARLVLGEVMNAVKQARCYGYFLRSTAAAYMWGDGADLGRARAILKEAQLSFLAGRDMFGAYTALTNLAVVSAYEGDFDGALKQTAEAYGGLRVFGLHNVEEVAVNLGSALLMTHRFSEAVDHLEKHLPTLDDDYPKALGQVTLATAMMCQGALSQAERVLADLKNWVRLVGLQEPIQLSNAANSLLGRVKNEHLSAVQILKECTIEWCQYWSQNPLAMLPRPYLAL